MEITSAEFIKGITGTNEIITDGKRNIAFIGRSNVGKSSLINSLAQKKGLAKSSGLPGRTREINFFLINKKFYFVDLPGYGFAKIKSQQKEKLRKMILWYLFSREVKQLKVVLIIDFNVGPTDFDRDMISLLEENKIDFVIVANKIDKVSKGSRLKQVGKIGFDNLFLYSTKTGEGRNDLLNLITQ